MSLLKDLTFMAEPDAPLYQQIYAHVRAAILSGQLQKGMKIPSSRALADELGISRNTVLNAYQQLFAEGYLESIEGKGTFVTHVLPELYLDTATPQSRRKLPVPQPHRLSQRAQDVLKAPTMPGSQAASWTFPAGQPALDAFPFDLWGKLLARYAHGLHPGLLSYQETAGYHPLREAIADHVVLARQVHCSPEQVIITNGSQGALDLAARVLLNPGEATWIEDPGYLGARGALLAAGAKLIPVPVDSEGMIVEAGIARAPDARLAYLTPSHQFPLGVTMSLTRRLALLDWAKQTGAYLLEDDYDSEYRFAGRPLASLQGLDDGERIIYIGTFSKVMFPALRLGYLIVPEGLVEAFIAMRRFTDYHHSSLEQAALTDFMTEGHFTRHIRRMRTLYAERRAVLLDAVRDVPLEIDAPEVGMHLVGWLPDGIDDRDVSERAEEQRVSVLPLSHFSIERLTRGGLVLGYAGQKEAEMREGVARLAMVLEEMLNGP